MGLLLPQHPCPWMLAAAAASPCPCCWGRAACLPSVAAGQQGAQGPAKPLWCLPPPH
jgi:hypothetical protein